jgi:ABC-type branched-subunit amino acid transport system substrate-binding protein
MKKIQIVTTISFIFLIFSGCKKDVPPYEIGVILEHAPENKEFNESVKRGIEIGFEEINMIKGVRGRMLQGVYIEVSGYDSSFITVIEEMVFKKGIKVIISHDKRSSELISSLDSANIILFSDWKDCIERSPCSIYAITPRLKTEGTLLGRLAVQEFRSKRAFLIRTSDERMATLFISGFERGYVEEGKGTINTMKLSGDNEEMARMFDRIISFNVDLIVIATFSDPSHLIRQLRNSGYHGRVLVPSTTAMLLQRDNDAIDLKNVFYAVSDYDPDSKRKIIVNFQDRFKTKYSKRANYSASVHYDLAEIIAYFLEINGDDVHRIHKFLGKIRDYRAVTGNTSYYPDGEVEKPMRLQPVWGKEKGNWD